MQHAVIGVVGLGPCLIHLVWRGKWDLAAVTAVAVAFTLPMRMLSPMGAVTLDSFGKWRLRTALLLLDSSTMMAAALIGAHLADLKGASIAVALQRLASGLVDFSFAVHTIGGRAADIVIWMPFLHSLWLPAGALVFFADFAATKRNRSGVALIQRFEPRPHGVFRGIAYAVDRRVMQEV